MYESLHIAKTGLSAQNFRMSLIANNLANVNTVGFKKDRGGFETLPYQNIRQPGSSTARGTESPTGLLIGTGVRVVSSEKNHSQGSLITTGNSLDLAIEGDGFFRLIMPDGTFGYTRTGTFSTNDKGEIVTAGGYLLDPQIAIPKGVTTINVGKDGTVTVHTDGTTTTENVGQVQLALFRNFSGLKPAGENLFFETDSSGSASMVEANQGGAGGVSQGTLEASNVNIVEEIVSMIETQRAYEMTSKAISSVDSMVRFFIQNT
jgi:flagellar basal-body rod protein FlgG